MSDKRRSPSAARFELSSVLTGFAARHALQAHAAHQPLDCAARHALASPDQLSPDLSCAIDAEVLIEDAPDFLAERGVAPSARRQSRGIAALQGMSMVGGRGDRQYFANRLDPVRFAMSVDEGDHGLNRRSNSACAKVSLAWRSSRFSRSSAFSRARSSLVSPARLPASRSACRNQRRKLSPCNQSSGRSTKSPRIPNLSPPGVPAPSEPQDPEPQVKGSSTSASSFPWPQSSRVGASGKPGACVDAPNLAR